LDRVRGTGGPKDAGIVQGDLGGGKKGVVSKEGKRGWKEKTVKKPEAGSTN